MMIKTQGESMIPTLKDGVCYEIDVSLCGSFNKGDIIVFHKDGLTICHRIVGVFLMKNGNKYYKTKGDNCVCNDPYAITDDMVIGRIII